MTGGYCRFADVYCPNAGGGFCCENGDTTDEPPKLPELPDADAAPAIDEPEAA